MKNFQSKYLLVLTFCILLLPKCATAAMTKHDQSLLECYQLHLSHVESDLIPPETIGNRHFLIWVNLFFDNGLNVIYTRDTKEYTYNSSCYDMAYKEKEKFSVDLEAYLQITNSKRKEREFRLLPHDIEVDILRTTNEIFFETLPQIKSCEVIETVTVKEGWFWNDVIKSYHIEIELTDGSKWLQEYGKGKPNLLWKAGDRIIVLVNPNEIFLVNVEENVRENYLIQTLAAFEFMGFIPK